MLIYARPSFLATNSPILFSESSLAATRQKDDSNEPVGQRSRLIKFVFLETYVSASYSWRQKEVGVVQRLRETSTALFLLT